MAEFKHVLVPRMTLASEKEVEKLMADINCTKEQLPKMLADDPAVASLEGAKVGDVVKIFRHSHITDKDEIYWRVIVE